jgi:hypothetical protein
MTMGVRTYVPNLGRFLQTDPVSGGSLNSYEYSGQDPVNGLDLDGRMWNPFRAFEDQFNGVVKRMGRALGKVVKRCVKGSAIGAAAATADFIRTHNEEVRAARGVARNAAQRIVKQHARERLIDLATKVPRANAIGLAVSCVVG